MRRSLLKRLSVIASLLVLVAPVRGAEPLQDPSQFHYVALPTDGQIDARVDAAGPRFVFKTGASAFAAFRLPDAKGRYIVDVLSFLDPPQDPAKSRVFYPLVALLSDDFFVTRSLESGQWRFDLPMYGRTEAPAYRLVLGVDTAQTPERYLVIYTADAIDGTPLVGASSSGRLRISVHPDISADE
jgi:hypothetical protein